MKETLVTTKIERSSLQHLKVIAALTRERMTDVLKRLLATELERVQMKGDTSNVEKDI